MAKILPGEYYFSIQGELIATLLGSCVAACVRDPDTGTGGMNHIMLPQTEQAQAGWHGAPELSAATRYGNVAMERLLNELFQRGARRERIEVKVFGGASLGRITSRIGDENAQFVMRFLQCEGLVPTAWDLGGNQPRRLVFDTRSGKVQVKKLPEIDIGSILSDEKSYRRQLEMAPTSGEIELFS